MSRQEQPNVTCPVITAAEPQLLVADVRASCDFFSQKLGFKIAFVYGDPPFYGQVMRSEEHTSELQSHSFISYAVFCLKKKPYTGGSQAALTAHHGLQPGFFFLTR